MTAEDAAAFTSLVNQASIIKDMVTGLGIQVEALEQQARVIGRRIAEQTKAEARKAAQAANKTEPTPPRRHYGGPRKVS